MKELCLVAGEASGDAQGALLVKALQARQPDLNLWGAAGPRMRALGVESFLKVEDLAVMGFSEIFRQYPAISQQYKKILHEIELRSPSAVIFIDYPGFNLRLLRDVALRGIPTFYHIPPKVWSHGVKRVEFLKRYARGVNCILPFEEKFFANHGVPVQFVGNPLFDSIEEYKAENKIAKDPSKIGLLPGSRIKEVQRLLPLMVEAFCLLKKTHPHLHAEIPVASTLEERWVEELVADTLMRLNQKPYQKEIHLHRDTYSTMASSTYAWVCSGTATLETALFSTPHSALYKVSWLSEQVGKRIITVPFVSLVNLCAEKKVIPEFLQSQANPQNLAAHALSILNDHAARRSMEEDFAVIQKQFPRNAADRSALHILQCLGLRS